MTGSAKVLRLVALLLASSCLDADQLILQCVDAGRCAFEPGPLDAGATDAGPVDAGATDAGPVDPCVAPPRVAPCEDNLAFTDDALLVLRLQRTDAGFALGFLEVLSATDGGPSAATIDLSRSLAGQPTPLFDAEESFQGALSRSGDGRFVTLAAYLALPEPVMLDGGLLPISRRAGVQRVVLSLDACGTITQAAKLVDLGGTRVESVPLLLRAATTVNGGQFWSVGNASGLRTFRAGDTTSTPLVENPGSIRHVQAGEGRLFAALGPMPFNGARVISWQAPPHASACQSVLTLPWVQLSEPTALSTAGGRLFVAEGAGDGGVSQYTLAGGTEGAWFPAGASPICTHLAVRGEGQGFQVVCRTAAGVVATASSSSGAARVLLTPPPGSVYRGVAFAPTSR